MLWIVQEKVQFRAGEMQLIHEKSVKLHHPDMKVKKKLKKDGPETLRRQVIHVAESWFMSESVISCWKVHFHVISRECTKPDMNMHFGDMKL